MCSWDVVGLGEWTRTIAAAISPVLVVVGWRWVNKQNNLREQRKELRQVIDRSLKLVNEIVELGIEYHGAGADARKSPDLDGWKITMMLGQVSGNIKLLRDRGLIMQASNAPYIRLKQILTGQDFMTKDWKPWAADDIRWMDAMHATNNLTHALDKIFFESFAE